MHIESFVRWASRVDVKVSTVVPCTLDGSSNGSDTVSCILEYPSVVTYEYGGTDSQGDLRPVTLVTVGIVLYGTVRISCTFYWYLVHFLKVPGTYPVPT